MYDYVPTCASGGTSSVISFMLKIGMGADENCKNLWGFVECNCLW